MGRIGEDIAGLKKLVSTFVDEPYRPAMNLLAVKTYRNHYTLLKNSGFEQPANYTPFELTLNEIIYESNSRFRQ